MQGLGLLVRITGYLNRNIYLFQLTQYYLSTKVNWQVNTGDYTYILNSPRLSGKQIRHAGNIKYWQMQYFKWCSSLN